MAYYVYRQNNSGGHYDIDLDVGLNVNVIVEANSEDEANTKAEAIGVYFDGVRGGVDCECCGDRWSSPYEIEAEELINYNTDSGVSIHLKENA